MSGVPAIAEGLYRSGSVVSSAPIDHPEDIAPVFTELAELTGVDTESQPVVVDDVIDSDTLVRLAADTDREPPAECGAGVVIDIWGCRFFTDGDWVWLLELLPNHPTEG